MNSKSTLIISIVVIISFILYAHQSEACLKKVRNLLRKKGKDKKPAVLTRDEAAYIKYSHAERSNFYLEIIRHLNKTIEVRELDHPPVVLSQMKVEDVQVKRSSPEEPDAEYIDTNGKVNPESIPEVITSNDITPSATQTNPVVNAGTDEEEVEILSPEDESVRREWGGHCMATDWNRCNKIRRIVVVDVIHTAFERASMDMDCLVQPVLCLKNGWTANRCHILCMASKCNKNLYFDWDAVVNFEAPCRYRK